MKARYPLLILCLLLIALPASAALINGSIILGNTPGTSVHLAYPSDPTSYFAYNAPSGEVIAFQQYNLQWTEGTTTYFTLTRSDGSTIAGSFNLHTTSLIEGLQIATITDGTTLTETYPRIPGFNAIYPKDIYGIFVKSNVSADYYFVLTTSTGAVVSNQFDVGAPFDLDTTRDAYITLVELPSAIPVIKSSTQNNNAGTFLTYVAHTPIASFVYSVINSNNPAVIESQLDRLLRLVSDVMLKIGELATATISFSGMLMALVVFLYLPQIFLTIVVAYTIIAMILSIHDSDNLFKSMSKFMRYEMKLLRFFMEIFRNIKDVIKWW